MQAELLASGRIVHVGEWQGLRGGNTARTFELQNASFRASIPDAVHELAVQLRPNLPWAEDHFGERVGGEPLNPPPSAAHWPFAQKNHAEHLDEDGKFSHTYPERLWPKHANVTPNKSENLGVRFVLGDLEDVVRQFRRSLHTRQAFIPIWFPEDTGATYGQRVPCTIGYHLLVRDGQMSCNYYIRSCDLLRHFVDDVYMAMRLVQWMCARLRYGDEFGGQDVVHDVRPGELIMHIASLHVFEVDRQTLTYRHSVERRRNNG
jgi:hypothetical protein